MSDKPSLSFAIQNCNSLNLTGLSQNFDLKLAAIVQSRADVILLSDTRIISSRGVSSSQRICNSLRDCKIRKYNATFNSSSNSRGVAILLGTDLDAVVNKEYRDLDENYLILDVSLNGSRYGIGAIYGPNNTSREFFNSLRRSLLELSGAGVTSFVLGGDWNTTIDGRPIGLNIDTFQMSGLPNPKNSELLNNLCAEFFFIDPYRALYPNKRDYTDSPFGTVRLNRSRIDFFIVSSSIINSISRCEIAQSIACKLFDHKQVFLALNTINNPSNIKCRLSNSHLDAKLLSASVEIAVRRAHIYSLNCGELYPQNNATKTRELSKIREAMNI